MNVTVQEIPSDNQAPLVDAGPNRSIAEGEALTLNGSVSDDGLPIPPGQLTLQWSKGSGPGDVGFSDSNAATTTATFSQPGTYQLRLEAFDGALRTAGELTVTVTEDGDGGGSSSVGIWTSPEELLGKPTSGPAWDAVLGGAGRSVSNPDLVNQDDHTGVYVLAKAIVYTRAPSQFGSYRNEAIASIETLVAKGHPGGRTLAWGRNIGAYVIARLWKWPFSWAYQPVGLLVWLGMGWIVHLAVTGVLGPARPILLEMGTAGVLYIALASALVYAIPSLAGFTRAELLSELHRVRQSIRDR